MEDLLCARNCANFFTHFSPWNPSVSSIGIGTIIIISILQVRKSKHEEVQELTWNSKADKNGTRTGTKTGPSKAFLSGTPCVSGQVNSDILKKKISQIEFSMPVRKLLKKNNFLIFSYS